MSVSSSPRMPRVTVATKPTGTVASVCARSRSDSMAAGVSTGGSVFAMPMIPQ